MNIKKILNKSTIPRIFFIVLMLLLIKNATSQINDLSIFSRNDTIFFQEYFEDTNFSARGWYDNTNLILSYIEYIPGSNSSAEFHFLPGATTPTSGLSIRHLFAETDEVYVSYWVKYSANWQGSNQQYHPHEFLILTNENSAWAGPAYTHLTAYIEQNEGEPLLSIQDSENIDESNIGVDLTEITEDRAIAGCNGDSDGYGDGECYGSVGSHYNGKQWRAGSVYFQNTPGPYYKNDWHFIEAYFKLNSIIEGIGIADGILKYWYDGELIIDHTDMMMRTGLHQDQRFNQFMIAPWIGDGSPIEQTMWVDDLTVANFRETTGITPEQGEQNILLQLQNYPNPFNPTTIIEFFIQNDSKIELSIFNIKGQKINTLAQKEFIKGSHSINWNGNDESGKAISSGVYLFKLNVNGKTEAVKKCLLLK